MTSDRRRALRSRAQDQSSQDRIALLKEVDAFTRQLAAGGSESPLARAAASARTGESVARLLGLAGPIFDVHEDGAVGGAVDDSPAFARTVARCLAAGGGVIWFPRPRYTGTISIYGSNVKLVGAFGTTIRQPATTRRIVLDATYATNSFLVSSTTAKFTSADVGKTVLVENGARASGEHLIARIRRVNSGSLITLDTPCGTSGTGKQLQIGCGRNVIEFGKTYLGNFAPATRDNGIYGLTIDGGKSVVPAPTLSTEDVILHGIISTNSKQLTIESVDVIECHNTGIAVCIASDKARIAQVRINRCGNAVTGMPGFDINSSGEVFVSVYVADSHIGVRQLDNCVNCTWQFVALRSYAQGMIFHCQPVNHARGGAVRGVVQECAFGANLASAQILQNVRGHSFDLDVLFAGAVREAGGRMTYRLGSHGLQNGSESLVDERKPQDNIIRARLYRNGGAGVLERGLRNRCEYVFIENSAKTPLAEYALDVGGSDNIVRATFDDDTGHQLGCAVRPVKGEKGTAARGNRFDFPRANIHDAYEDRSGNRTNVAPRIPGGPIRGRTGDDRP